MRRERRKAHRARELLPGSFEFLATYIGPRLEERWVRLLEYIRSKSTALHLSGAMGTVRIDTGGTFTVGKGSGDPPRHQPKKRSPPPYCLPHPRNNLP